MTKYLLMTMLLSVPIYSHHVVDVLGGSGAIWGFAKQSEYESGNGTARAKLSDSIYMRDNIFLALRYSRYSGLGGGYFVWGAEIGALRTRPTVSGDWIFTRVNTDDKVTAESRQSVTQNSAPSINTGRASFHIGYNIPLNSIFAAELGTLVGLGYGTAKYSYQSPYSLSLASGSSSGAEGPAAHAAFRLALQLFPKSALAFAFEYRLHAEVLGSFFSLLPFAQSSTAVSTTVGHIFLVSVGYRFGIEAVQP